MAVCQLRSCRTARYSDDDAHRRVTGLSAMVTTCPFCELEGSRIFYESHLVVGLWDAHPVAPGHALIVTRRHVASWFEASSGERAELLDGIVAARTEIE